VETLGLSVSAAGDGAGGGCDEGDDGDAAGCDDDDNDDDTGSGREAADSGAAT